MAEADPQTTGPLRGIKVVEFAQNAAAPHCGRLLAGMGADVVKVEPIAGDAMRHLATIAPKEARAYALINPGKRGIRLDLGGDGAADVVRSLLEWADVSIAAFKSKDLDKFGLTWEAVSAINPRLVHLQLNAFGPEGPDADEGGYDVLVQGVSGMGFSMNRSDYGVPMSTRPAVFDFASGMMGSAGILAALRHRDLTGEGQRVDVSLLGTAMSLGTPMVYSFENDMSGVARVAEDISLMQMADAPFDDIRHVYEGKVVGAPGIFRLTFRHYVTADGMISVAGMSLGLVARFYELLDIEMPADPVRIGDGFEEIINEAEVKFRQRTTDEWLAILRAANFPCARYNFPYDAVDDPQVRANDYIVDLVHPTFGGYSASGMPLRMSASPVGVAGPSPRLGEHTVEVLAEMGFDADQIAAMEAADLVRGLYTEAEAED